jgi:hypothetical protein
MIILTEVAGIFLARFAAILNVEGSSRPTRLATVSFL